ncbi:hypothetical protein ALQ17_200110 [Pseudomonas fluorescens]|nr:hypothetical protein ALQ17_200110 [Pseudomonas fluorescens]
MSRQLTTVRQKAEVPTLHLSTIERQVAERTQRDALGRTFDSAVINHNNRAFAITEPNDQAHRSRAGNISVVDGRPSVIERQTILSAGHNMAAVHREFSITGLGIDHRRPVSSQMGTGFDNVKIIGRSRIDCFVAVDITGNGIGCCQRDWQQSKHLDSGG